MDWQEVLKSLAEASPYACMLVLILIVFMVYHIKTLNMLKNMHEDTIREIKESHKESTRELKKLVTTLQNDLERRVTKQN